MTAYLAERVPLRLFAPVAAVLAFAGNDATWPGLGPFLSDAALAFLLLVQFRIWDDVADRGRDALTHPGRVLVRMTSIAPVVYTCVAAAAANTMWVAARSGAGLPLVTFAGLNAVLAAWYVHRGPRSAAGDHLLLAKYPSFVLIVAGGLDHPPRLLLTMAAVYLGACVYEAVHDPASPAARHGALVASEALLLVVTIVAISVGGSS